MEPHGVAVSLERRRRRAVALFREGIGLREIGRRLDVSPSAVHRWVTSWKKKGDAALAARPRPGRPSRLTESQRKKATQILLQGAIKAGFPNELWTLSRIAAVIRREFGVSYHPSHVWKILQAEGWSCQVPERRAIQRNEEAIAHWKRYKWPGIKKSPSSRRSRRLS